MSWELKAKIPQKGDNEKILTPDSEEILLGPLEADVYLYSESFTNWELKSKIEP